MGDSEFPRPQEPLSFGAFSMPSALPNLAMTLGEQVEQVLVLRYRLAFLVLLGLFAQSFLPLLVFSDPHRRALHQLEKKEEFAQSWPLYRQLLCPAIEASEHQKPL